MKHNYKPPPFFEKSIKCAEIFKGLSGRSSLHLLLNPLIHGLREEEAVVGVGLWVVAEVEADG